MMGLRTMARLLWRPALLWMALPLFWAVAIPLLILGETGTPVRSIWTGDVTDPVRTAAWHVVVLVPAVLGLALAFPRLELQHALFSWMLPSGRRRLLVGTLAMALPAATVVALPVVRIAPMPVGLAAVAIAFFWFVTASAAVDVAVPRALRWSGVLALLLAALRPGVVGRLVESWPWAAGAGAVGAAASLLAVQFSRRSSRVRHFRWSSASTGATALYWAQRREVLRDWTHSLATGRVGPWLRAIAYEGSAGGAVPFPWSHALMAAFAVAWGHITNQPPMVVILGGLFLSHGRLQLASTVPYPLSRVRRAQLAATGNMIEAATFGAAMVAMLVAVRTAGVPVLGWFVEDSPRYGWAVVIGMTWAWAPIAQWSAIRWPGWRLTGRFEARFLVPWLAYALLATAGARLLTGQTPLALAAWVIGIAAAVQVAHWIAVYRHFARRDLV
jgi:hypothetical protein